MGKENDPGEAVDPSLAGLVEDEADHQPIDILLVEDTEADVKITMRAFKKARLKNNVFVVRDGQEALDYLYHQGPYADVKKFPYPDLILLDINMPKLNGYDVLKKIKGDPQLCATPVVMLTSSKSEEDIMKTYQSGATSYIQKPVNYEEFVKVIVGFNIYWNIITKLPQRS